MSSNRSFHIGGEQLPLFMPETTWEAPSSLPNLTNVTEVALDTENRDDGLRDNRGPGWATGAGYICGIGVAWKEETYKHTYIPITHPDSPNFDKVQVRKWLRDLHRRKVRCIYHNAAYDIGWTHQDLGMPVPSQVDDTACMAYMIDENRLTYQLNALCKAYGIQPKNDVLLKEAAIAMGVNPKQDIWKLPARYVADYGGGDALSTLMLAHKLRPILAEEQIENAYQLEMDLVPMVHAMRKRGICIDIDRCEELYKEFQRHREETLMLIQDKLGHSQVGMEELRSTSWLEKTFDALKISYPKTKKDRGSFDKSWMKNHKHWLPPLIIRARNFENAAEKFVKAFLIDFCTPEARIHPTINQYRGEDVYDDEARGGGTRTYRFSYTDPALQQIPHRDPIIGLIRSCFIGEDGEDWLSVDYSQQEYRLMVHYANILELPGAAAAAELYRDNPDQDFHQLVADWTGLDRKPAKDCNFAKAYGAGVRKFSIMIGKSMDEAARIMGIYDQKMPFVKALYEHTQRTATERGYIKLLDGARIRFDWWVAGYRPHGKDWNQDDGTADCRRDEAERRIKDPKHAWFRQALRRSRANKALNSLIQGGAARQTKIAMRDCWRAGYCPVLQMHDELCFSIADKKDADTISDIMRDCVPLSLPMKVDAQVSDSWHEKVET